MKSMKIASAAMLAMVGLGFAASPASANVADNGKSGTSTAQVNLTGGSDFELISVPDFAFTTKVTSSKYEITDGSLDKSIEVFRNYDFEKTQGRPGHPSEPISVKKIHATISDLKSETNKTVSVGSFSIGDVELKGTGKNKKLYSDTDITGTVASKPNNYQKAISKAGIKFTSTALEANDELTATITYTVVDASAGDTIAD